MKTLLNCDAVFDVLTAGPFPTGDRADQSIQQHLAACPPEGRSSLKDATSWA